MQIRYYPTKVREYYLHKVALEENSLLNELIPLSVCG